MTNPLSLISPARTFVRGLIARSVVGNSDEHIHAYARNRWGEYQGTEVTKAAVAAISSADTGGVDVARAFFGLVREQSILGRLTGLRRVPFSTRMLAVTAGSRGYWVRQGQNKPLSRVALAGSTLDPLKVAAILVVTKEMLRANDEAAEATLQDDLVRAVTVVLDEAFMDPDNAGVANEMPASIAYGATQIQATSDFGADLRAMIAAFKGDLGYAAFVTSPDVAVGIATMTDSQGHYLFPGIGARGGELLGIPVLTTRSNVTTTSGSSLLLIDPTGIAAAVGSMTLDSSDQATLQMSDDPNDAGSPVFNVSLYQTNGHAYKAEIDANWSRQRPGSVVALEGLL
ncbi:phage major capsid protein [Variovorax ginsengisoli]|uniref:Phage major capsid protein n=1 Tax=Variovorax ginsengisoli TaxID=363844 RepID=A0ABT8S6W8_9BURK|nr:phage major capsid protein [Variovorax ginsengisoli]MDN8615491.1 phage major capsid protein [Variovorax ginsengisoli]MDO1534661.1 phage major capsid protein [Variovorax ginsengisoli]